MTFHGEASNLDPLGFNDHASSAIVREGIWEGCADAYFQGPCAQLGPGEYPQLDRRLNRSISSLRVLSWDPAYRGNYPDTQYYAGDAYRDEYYWRHRADSYDRGYYVYPHLQPYAYPNRDRDYYGYPYHDHGQ